MSPTASAGNHIPFDWPRFEAVLFDLDGVLTPTASLHAVAWKRTFDSVLASLGGPNPDPFTDDDYRRHVDGRPRYEGVAAFLSSRELNLPWGEPGDQPGFRTVCAIGNMKNSLVTEILATERIDPFPGSVALLDHLENLDLRLAVVSSSANAAAVLESARLSGRFAIRIDGVVAADRHLAGKPAPDTFLAAAADLGVEPSAAVVIEDAEAGVAAGVAGGFGSVIGVDRHHDPEPLHASGADLVVADLGELVP